jgi:hypothetical protein
MPWRSTPIAGPGCSSHSATGCTNVVQHAVGADGYEVRVTFDDCCVVDIIDNGRQTVRLPIEPSMPDAIEGAQAPA